MEQQVKTNWLVVATRNRHKVREIRALLPVRFRCLSLKYFPEAPAVVEDADSFAGNAVKKAVGLAAWLAEVAFPAVDPEFKRGSYVLADDSGLEVDALNGAPGVHSARFAALDTGQSGNSSDAENNAKLLRLLASVPEPDKTGRFRCVLALTSVEPTPKQTDVAGWLREQTRVFSGVCEGRIMAAPRGVSGFGYDPLFLPAGHDQTFGELGAQVKNRISHRARALEQLRAFLEAPTAV
jgi:XTP/dITP diphosphohydrolase